MADDCWVLRGGNLRGYSAQRNERSVFEEYGLHGICVGATNSLSPEQTATAMEYRGRTIMVVSAGLLRSGGFEVIREPGKSPPSALVLFPSEPTEELWELLRDLFSSNGSVASPNCRTQV